MKKIPRIISKVYQVDMHTSCPFKNIFKGISEPNYITFVNSDIHNKMAGINIDILTMLFLLSL